MNRINLFLCCLLFSSQVISQQPSGSYNSLLWRISGKGLSKPSYLFGTIHITDKRVFHFTDSLYKGLEQTEGFAAELDMTTFLSAYLEEFMNSDDEDSKPWSKKRLVDSLDKKILAKYKVALEKEFKKPLDKITVGELTPDNNWMNEMLRTGEMNTFMDAYLFDIAKRQGKWVGGIEDPEDQLGIKDEITLMDRLDNLLAGPKKEKQTLEWMIKTYLKQDLDAIDRSDEIWQGSKDVILVKRNAKMARRIDSLANLRSTFFAVGAAHIPGDEGVVNLLRKRGFVVSPVVSINRIAPESYTYKEVELPWINVPVTDSLYSIQTPGKSESFKMEEAAILDMKYYFDMGNMRVFFTAAIPVPPAATKNPDSILNKLSSYYEEKGMDLTEKKITLNATPGREIVASSPDAEIRMQVFIGPSFIAMNLISSAKKQALFGNDPDRFFNSFKVNQRPKAIIGSGKDKWQKYTYDKLGFSVELPVGLREQKQKEIDESWDQQTFQGMDLVGKTFYGLVVSTVKKGYYSSLDSSFFEELAENVITNMKGEKITAIHSRLYGYPSYNVIAKTTETKEIVYMRMLFVNKGPRRYFLFTTSEDAGQPDESGRRYFESFAFLPDTALKWSKNWPGDKSFSMWVPGIITQEKTESEYEFKYYIEDTLTRLQFNIDKEVYPSYYWADNDSTLFADKISTFKNYDDSFLIKKPITIGKLKGYDILIQLGETHNLKKMRLLLNGDTLYSIYSYLPMEYVQRSNYKRLFDEFTVAYQVSDNKLYKRKPKELLLALQTKDSAAFAMAKSTLASVTFKQEDIPLLQQALLYTYKDFDTSYYFNVGQSISNQLEQLDSNHTSIDFVRKNYNKLSGEKEVLKPYLLGLLSYAKTKESYELLKELLSKNPPKIKKEYYLRGGLYDSLQLTRLIYPEVLSLAADPGLYDFINDLTVEMLDSNLVDVGMISKYEKEFLQAADRILALPEEDKLDNSYRYNSLVKLLGKINTPRSILAIKEFGKINDKDLKLGVIIALAANKQEPDDYDLQLLAEDDQYRSDLYEKLEEINQVKYFPIKFLSQKLLGQSVVYNYASEDEYYPDEIEFIEERTELYKGKRQKFYLYKVCFSGDDEEDGEGTCYLGVAGPYSLSGKDYGSKHEVSGIYWNGEYDEKEIINWLKEMIKDSEERENKKDE